MAVEEQRNLASGPCPISGSGSSSPYMRLSAGQLAHLEMMALSPASIAPGSVTGWQNGPLQEWDPMSLALHARGTAPVAVPSSSRIASG